MGNIYIHFEGIESFELPWQTITDWIEQTAISEHHSIGEINYIFCSDDYLLSINQEYLNHDYYTDIITFDNGDGDDIIMSDMFISRDRVEENAKLMTQPFQQELCRVMIHGLLHLVGYKDKTTEEERLMREKENTYLDLLSQH
ncbi:MAG: rRNA maturation RNase YbeY [Cyclobacteriaceae bacterium]|nr:rRNA maturation RNase YbeY [Cyclobacteriaceae bacterium]